MNNDPGPVSGENSGDIEEVIRSLEAIAEQQRTLIDIYIESTTFLHGMVTGQRSRFENFIAGASGEPQQSGVPATPIDFVLPIYNALHHARASIRSVLAYATHPYRLIIVNDGSDNYTTAELRALVAGNPDITLIEHASNAGYLASANEAISLGNAEICVILDSDAMLSPGACERLRKGFISDEKIGMITAVSTRAIWTKIPFPPGTNILDLQDFIAAQDDLDLVDVGNASGFFLAVRRSLFDKLGLFLDAYSPGYWEDADFCMLAQDNNWRVVVDRQLYIYHHGGGTTPKLRNSSHMLRNRETFMARWQNKYYELESRWKADNPMVYLSERLDSDVPPSPGKPRVLFLNADGRNSQQNMALVQLVNSLIVEGISANIVWLAGFDAALADTMPMYFEPIVGATSTDQLSSYGAFVATCDKTAAIIKTLGNSFNARLFHLATAKAAGEITDPVQKARTILRSGDHSTTATPDMPAVLPGVNTDIFYPSTQPRYIDLLLNIPKDAWAARQQQIMAFCEAFNEACPDLRLGAVGPKELRQYLPRIIHVGTPQRLTELAEAWSDAGMVMDWSIETHARSRFLEISACGGIAVLDARSEPDQAAQSMRNCIIGEFANAPALALEIGKVIQQPALMASIRETAIATSRNSSLAKETAQMLAILLGEASSM